MGNKLAVAAVILALLALLLQFGSRGGSERPAARTPTVPSDRAALLTRIAALEAAVEELRQARTISPLVPPREPAGSGPDPNSLELARRLEVLERSVQALHGSVRDGTREPTDAEKEFFVRLQASRKTFEEAVRRAQDLHATETERLAALRSLRGQQDAQGIDARRYVLDDMLRLARTSQDGETRADVWRQLSHLNDPLLRQPLLDALAFDEHAKAREEAAETLADFLPDRGVEGALRAARDNDRDSGVRRQAAESLASAGR